MDKKKIAQIVRSPAGGIRKHIVTIIENLEDDFEFILITDEAEADQHYKEFKKNTRIKIFNLDINDKPGFSDIFNIIKVYKILYMEKVDIVHGHGAKGGLYARVSGWLNSNKILYTAHGGSLHSMHGYLKNKLYILIEKFLYSFTDILIFESKYSMDSYHSNIYSKNEKFKLNYNGVEIPEDADHYKHKKISLDDVIIIGAFGLLRKIKGHDLLVRICSKLKEDNYNIELRIFGNGEEKENLINLSKSLGFESNLKIFDHCDNIKDEFRDCHVVAHPSYFESYGYVPVEAMSFGVPVIFSYVGGLREVSNLTDNKHVFMIEDENDFFFKLKRLIESKKLSQESVKYINNIKKHLSEDAFIEKIKIIYRY